MECAWWDICLGQGISEWMWISLYFYDICYSSEDGFIPGTLSWVDMLLFYFGTFFYQITLWYIRIKMFICIKDMYVL